MNPAVLIASVYVFALVLAGAKGYPLFAHILGFVAVTTATINVVGGFGITDRMLKMFGKRKAEMKAGTQ
jgi:NAD(P) transhydrogenase subunit alpha